jgi:hypothetical protein
LPANPRLVAAAVAATGVLSIGGVTLAAAQEPPPPTTTPPAEQAPAPDREGPSPDGSRKQNCRDRDRNVDPGAPVPTEL